MVFIMTNRLRYALKTGIIGTVIGATIGYNISYSNNLEYYNANKQILKEIKHIKKDIYEA